MREGYGKSKLFMLVVFSLVMILLTPYGVFGGVKDSGDTGGMEPESTAGQETIVDKQSVTHEGSMAHEQLDGIVGITVKDTERNVIYASGNGVVLFCGEDGVCIVTAGHVLDAVETYRIDNAKPGVKILISFWDTENWAGGPDTEVECSRYESVAGADLAFLFLSREQSEGLEIMPAICAEKEVYDSLRAGDTVRSIGWDDGQKVAYEGVLQENWIFVEDFSQYMMAAECVMNPGMSGCGLYNAADELIGIACGGNENGVLVAVPLSVVQARLGETR